MNTLNAILTSLTDLLLAPLAWSPALDLVFWSAVIGVLMTIAFRHTSNQRALRAVTDRTRANLLAMKLFKDDLGVALRCQGALLKAIGRRLWLSLPPLLVMIVPFIFIVSQLALRYEYRPLGRGDRAVVEVRLSPSAWEANRNAVLEAPPGVTVETPHLRDAAAHTVYWRIRADQPSPGPLRWRIGDQVIEKQLAVAADPARVMKVNPCRPGASLADRLLYPGEPGFASDSPVQAVVVHHALRTTPIFGLHVHWLITFIVLSMVFALLAKPFLRVQF